MSEKITPSFFLRGINIYDVARNYLAGKYSKQDVKPIKSSIDSCKVSSAISGDESLSFYSTKDKNGVTTLIYTCGKNYNRDTPCHWCRRKFLHNYIGIPITYEPKGDIIKITTSGYYCSFGCADAHLQEKINLGTHTSKYSIYNKSTSYLNRLFNLVHQGKRLIRAKDWELLAQNGGSLTDAEYDDTNYVYECVGNIVISISVTEYRKDRAPINNFI